MREVLLRSAKSQMNYLYSMNFLLPATLPKVSRERARTVCSHGAVVQKMGRRNQDRVKSGDGEEERGGGGRAIGCWRVEGRAVRGTVEGRGVEVEDETKTKKQEAGKGCGADVFGEEQINAYCA